MRHPHPFRRWVVSTLAALLFFAAPGRVGGDEGDEDDPPAAPPGMEDGAMGDGAMDDGDEGDPDDPDKEDVPFSKEVNLAILKGAQWLQKKQRADGSWGPLDVSGGAVYGGGQGKPYDHPAGLTGLALYALLKSDVPADSASIKKGFAWLQKTWPRPQGSYELSVVLLAVCATADPLKKTAASDAVKDKIRARLSGPMRKWAQELVETLVKKHVGRRGWRYQLSAGTGKVTEKEPNGSEDSSSTQLAALALFAADRCGVTAPSPLWVDVLRFAIDQQEDDGPEVVRWAPTPDAPAKPDSPYAPAAPPKKEGPIKDKARGFTYIKKSPDPEEARVTGSMTGCGLATVCIARFVLELRKDKGWKKDGYDQTVQKAVYDALAWIDLNWSPFDNVGKGGYHTYWLYGVERSMDLIGLKLIGKHQWYMEGAKQLVGRQNAEKGFWDTKSTHNPSDVIDTCFALLFLKRSTKGVIPFPDITGGSDEPIDNRGK